MPGENEILKDKKFIKNIIPRMTENQKHMGCISRIKKVCVCVCCWCI